MSARRGLCFEKSNLTIRMRTLPISALVPCSLVAVVLLSTGCSIVVSYNIPDGSVRSRSFTSVAGDIEVGRQATIRNARTVAGNIEIHEGGRAGNLATVAGRVRLAADVTISGSIKTVAGDIEVGHGSMISGDVSTEVGKISMTGGVVQGNVILANGKLEIVRTRVVGAVRVKHADGDEGKVAELTIGRDSEVAALVVAEKTVVHLRIHRTAKVGSIKGAEAEYYD